MKNLFLSLFLFFAVSVVMAQKPLSNSRINSYYTYIYPVKDADVEQLYGSKKESLDDHILSRPIDSARTDRFILPNLGPGNYLKVWAVENKLSYSLIENHSVFLKILDNRKDLRFVLLNTNGTEITNAEAWINNKKVSYNTEARTWQFKHIKKNVLLKVKYNGLSNYFNIDEQEGYNHYKLPFWRRVVYNTPIRHVWLPIHNVFKPVHRGNNSSQNYTGYMVFNKPMYKPGDTVKFKAYIFKRSSREPVTQKSLLIKLAKLYSSDKGKIIGTVSSYRDGAFERTFVLNDSLKLQLDQNYNVTLKNPKKKINGENEALISSYFKYEDYELKSTKFMVRADKEEHSPGSPVSLYLKATDENDLPVPDGRVELTLITSYVKNYARQHVFVPDTLWRHKLMLDPVGETKVVIPDSIFPKANIRYRVESRFLNSNNEVRTQSTNLTFTNEDYKIITRLDQDTLKISYQVKGVETAAKATITTQTANLDDIAKTTVMLPAKIVVNPTIREYDIATGSVSHDIELKEFSANISSSAYRNADSVFIQVSNPRHIPFWYTVFSGNKIKDSGKGTQLNYKKEYHKSGNVFLLLNWIWGGEAQHDEVTILYRDKLLDISVKQPVAVYPGQQVEMEINVKDGKGRPVADADLTAYSATSKFTNYRLPSIPYFGKMYPARKLRNVLNMGDKAVDGTFALNWERWSHEMGLDSIAYFQFTHPDAIFRIEEHAPDTLTQIAPFVVNKGEILPVYVLYIDDRPVYFNQAEQLQRYSFRVKPGSHKLQLRTLTQSITVDEVKVAKGKKLILSINADTVLNKQARFAKMPDTLTRYEAALLNKYMMRVVDNFGWKTATLSGPNELVLLNRATYNYNGYNNSRSILAGPFPYNYANFTLHGETPRSFLVEPGYSYQFMPGLIKQKSISGRYPFNTKLFSNQTSQQYNQYVLTNNDVDTLWQQYLDERSHTTQLFPREYIGERGNGKLSINIDGYGDNNVAYKNHPLIKNIIVYRYDDPDYMRVYPGNTTDMGYLKPGNYRLFFLLHGDSYCIREQVNVKANGINYYKIALNIKPKDSVSTKMAGIMNSRPGLYGSDNNDRDVLSLKEAFNDTYLDRSIFKGQMTGTVYDNDKQALPGVTVTVKGTSRGVSTDINGHFKLDVPNNGKLRVMYIGFETQEIPIISGENVKIILRARSSSLNEVTVVGYGSSMRRDMAGSVSTVMSLQGKLAGVITIRGAGSMSADKAPLYVIDGVIVDAGVTNLNPADIGEITVLKSAAATAIYGARAANGVILITTKKKSVNGSSTDPASPGQQQTLRTNFSDYAFWQPKLKTDAQGKARFTVTFPDDITKWRTTVIGIAGRLTGFSEGQIKSFKSLSANFVAPQFAIKGDELNPIGKIMNYTTENVNVNRVFKYNGQVIKQGALTVKNSLIDTFKITAADADSLKFEYTIKKDNGYFDGERRSIPVFEQGVLETKGSFADLENDTTVSLKFDPALGAVTFRAEASVLPVLTDETERLRNYEYLCNEQLASKLKGLLVQKRISKYLGQPFKWNKNVLELIKKLQDNRRGEGTWGWWKDTDEELWISLHATEALLDAQREGYTTQIDKRKLIDYLVYRVNAYTSVDKLDAISLLIKLGAKADYEQLIADYQKQIPKKVKPSAYEKMRLMLVKQQAGLPIVLDSLNNNKRSTMFGNVYWGEDCYRFFDNSVQLSVMAYQLYKAEGKHAEILPKIRNYFLEERRADGWRNTYESSLILETILPDLLSGSKLPQQQVLTLSGDKSETVTKFPYSTTLSANTKLTVAKKGDLPVYITGYQQFWNKHPEKVSKNFTVNTWFDKDGSKLTKLKGGEAVTLKAEVTARADADFVMIEIPIPAGCSYESKEQPYWGNEVHREYFKNKVSIFCRKLKQGKYKFDIKLMPRYSGNYSLNPAKAEMMYFPVFYGREDMKRVEID